MEMNIAMDENLSQELHMKIKEIIDFDIAKWDVSTIGNLFSIQQGKSVSKKNRQGHSQHPFLRTANVFWGYLDLSILDTMNFTQEEEKKLQLIKDDLLVCEGGEIGRSAVWNEEIEDCFYQNHLHRLRRRADNIHPEFYMYWMQAAFLLLDVYSGQGNKATIPNLSQSRLSSFVVPVPPIYEQRAIAHALRTVQDAKEARQREVALERERKAVLKQYLFTHGTHGEPPRHAEIGEIPQSWLVTTIFNACERIIDYRGKTPKFSESGIVHLRSSNVKNGRLVLDEHTYVSDETYKIFMTRGLPKAGDVVFTTEGPLGEAAIVPEDFIFSFLYRTLL